MPRIVVIGGGAAGSALVGELLRPGRPTEADIVWLVGQRAPGRGIAYSTSADHHLLNVRAAGMGLFVDDIGAFLKYTAARGLPVKGADFVPRSWFGDFVESSLARLVAESGRPGRLSVQSREAVAVRGDAASGYTVTAEDGESWGADAVVLAVGALPPAPLSAVTPEALRSGAYVADPWQWPTLAQAPERVVVVGTGLTAVDVLLSASTLWPHAQLTAVSRHGQLPRTHASHPGEPYPHQQELIDAFQADPRIRAWLRTARTTLAGEDVDWRAVVDGLRGATPGLWRRLDAAERARFVRHLRWLWEPMRHRMPPQTATAIARLRTQGRLKIVAGRVLAVSGEGPLDVRIRPRGGEIQRSLAADLVIQATGLTTLTEGTSHRLIGQMIAEDVARPDRLGLGLCADAQGRLRSADGSAAPTLRAIGTLLRGALWECSGLPEIRAMARVIADDLARELAAPARRRLGAIAAGAAAGSGDACVH